MGLSPSLVRARPGFRTWPASTQSPRLADEDADACLGHEAPRRAAFAPAGGPGSCAASVGSPGPGCWRALSLEQRNSASLCSAWQPQGPALAPFPGPGGLHVVATCSGCGDRPPGEGGSQARPARKLMTIIPGFRRRVCIISTGMFCKKEQGRLLMGLGMPGGGG